MATDDERLGTESSLTTYAGPYVTDMLGKGEALADLPYEGYTGPLTAGPSDLQTKAFEGIGSLDIPTEGMGAFTPDTFTAEMASQYMNPYLDAVLAPQLEEARRQSQISALEDRTRLTKAGAYGGSRQAIMDAERDRNLQQNLSTITGQGYSDAFTKGLDQFNIEQNRARDAQNDLNRYGLGALGLTSEFGGIQQGIEQAGIDADKLQFEEERDYPYKAVQFMQSLLQGLPLETQEYLYSQPSFLQSAAGGSADVMAFIDDLMGTDSKDITLKDFLDRYFG